MGKLFTLGTKLTHNTEFRKIELLPLPGNSSVIVEEE